MANPLFNDDPKLAGPAKKVILWNADDPGWLKILSKYQSDGLVKCCLIGDNTAIENAAKQAQINISDFEIVNSLDINDNLTQIKNRLASNACDILIRGNIGVKDSLQILLKTETGFKPGKKSICSGISLHYVKAIDRTVIVSDGIVNPTPDLNRKIAIVNNAVKFAHKLGIETPKVAMLAAVEAVYPVMQHTVEGAAIAKMSDRGQIKGCYIDGPLSMDCAVIESAAKSKGVTGKVGGQADILIAPNIETGYGMLKAFSKFVGAPSGSLVTGGKIPFVMTSRWDNEQIKENSLLMAML